MSAPNARDERFRVLLPTFWARCATCAGMTVHAGYGDEHGCEFGTACTQCGTFSRIHGCAHEAAEPAITVRRFQRAVAKAVLADPDGELHHAAARFLGLTDAGDVTPIEWRDPAIAASYYATIVERLGQPLGGCAFCEAPRPTSVTQALNEACMFCGRIHVGYCDLPR